MIFAFAFNNAWNCIEPLHVNTCRRLICMFFLAVFGGLALLAEAKKPNVILILADDLGIGDVGAYNSKSRIKTPNIDRLAREGFRFLDAHAGSSRCGPRSVINCYNLGYFISNFGLHSHIFRWRNIDQIYPQCLR